MIEKHAKLITVLVFAAMLLILAYLVMSVTSCSSMPPQSQEVSTERVMPTVIEDGTLYHPVTIDPCPCGVPYDLWSVRTVNGHETWTLNWLYGVQGGATYALHTGEYIWYRNAKYRIIAIDRKALTMTVSGPLDCCAG